MLLCHGISRMVAEAQALKEKHTITQVCGLMKAKKVLDILKDMEHNKEQQAKSREEAPRRKRMQKKHSLNANHDACVNNLNV